jgi:ABC-2 type transport system permease protein
MSLWRAMAWKELREVLAAEGRPAVQMAIAGVVDVALGILVPIGLANALLDAFGLWPTIGLVGLGVAGVCGFMGILGPTPTIADAFAGERERHTLETLLASPIPDRSILWGKMAAQYALVGLHVAVVCVTAGITSAILLGFPGLLVLPAGLIVGGLAAALTSSFVIGLGVLLSLRAPTVKKAQERLGYAMMPFFILPGLLPSVLRAGGVSPDVTLVLSFVAPLAFLAVAIGFNVAVFARFRRDRLVGLG